MSRRSLVLGAVAAAFATTAALLFGPRLHTPSLPAGPPPSDSTLNTIASTAPPRAPGASASAAPQGDGPALDNLAAYLPAQCYAVTREPGEGRAHNGCFACHQGSQAPNYVDDADVQLTLSLPRFATVNRWTNLLHPPPPVALSDAEILAWVRRSNYLAEDGTPRLARALAAPPPAWDADRNGRWDGVVPDCHFHADADGWDRAPDGRPTGWRAYAYAPMPGLFWPTNGSAGDAFVRLPEPYRKDAEGRDSLVIYALNLAILEAYVRRTDVPIPPTDEAPLGADLDGDGALGRARKVAFVWPPREGRPFHYVGMAASLDPARAGWPAAGLFPTGAEIVHSVRYLDVQDGHVRMAARMKELRHMRKDRWLTYSDLDLAAKAEMREKAQKPDRLRRIYGDAERGIATGTGWRMAAFIEDAGGELRPQSVEETTACIGCHGGVGATVDSTFSFARKLGEGAFAAGWYHWDERGLAGIPEPRRADGRGEYQVWLEEVGGADDLRTNDEAARAFLGEDGRVRPAMARALASDVSVLLVPSPGRALALDRAYLAVVKAQSYALGRDVVLAPPRVHERVEQDAPTGIDAPVPGPREAPAGVASR